VDCLLDSNLPPDLKLFDYDAFLMTFLVLHTGGYNLLLFLNLQHYPRRFAFLQFWQASLFPISTMSTDLDFRAVACFSVYGAFALGLIRYMGVYLLVLSLLVNSIKICCFCFRPLSYSCLLWHDTLHDLYPFSSWIVRLYICLVLQLPMCNGYV